ncbi:hypothetical protein [Oceanobacillus neutriphilus]|uniref:DUF3278 domain-containing protein n=1 Tax=Oceanobacillus neutriphilus TaxID=531815 RepID=A0ABQ2NSQ6_9BACI|nr:hypothetical protein [Oceanobacillus neutriphilus]GGP09114.1 hypothetical protein GCM10011346_11870 [Oceanobacillus neutriphilus]
MKKIIFEQTGNIILILLATLAMIQTVLTATVREDPIFFSFEFGIFWFLFLGWLIVFGIARFWYGKKKNNEGYSTKKGEFSAQDEREELISKKASLITFKMLIPLWIILLAISFGLNLFLGLFFSDIKIFQTMIIGILGGSLIICYLTYLIAWVTLDSKD